MCQVTVFSFDLLIIFRDSYLLISSGVTVCQVALCIVHTTKYYYVWSPTQKWKKWRRSTTLFFYAGLYHAVHVPLLSLTCGTSSTCRV